MTIHELGTEYNAWLNSLDNDYASANQGWTQAEIDAAIEREAALWAACGGQPAAQPLCEREPLPAGLTYWQLLREW